MVLKVEIFSLNVSTPNPPPVSVSLQSVTKGSLPSPYPTSLENLFWQGGGIALLRGAEEIPEPNQQFLFSLSISSVQEPQDRIFLRLYCAGDIQATLSDHRLPDSNAQGTRWCQELNQFWIIWGMCPYQCNFSVCLLLCS